MRLDRQKVSANTKITKEGGIGLFPNAKRHFMQKRLGRFSVGLSMIFAQRML
jgi:hypothetical protein